MGHARIASTLDLYCHPLPGSEDEAPGLLDTYLSRSGAMMRVARELARGGREPAGDGGRPEGEF
jgi:hypothetical protein